MIYTLFIFRTDQDTFNGYFPDVKECVFAGDTLEDTLADAKRVLIHYTESLSINGKVLPAPKRPVDYLDNLAITQNDGYLTFIEFNPSRHETKAVRFNLTMPGNLLNAIDDYIEKNGQYKSRSAFLSELARKEITLKSEK